MTEQIDSQFDTVNTLHTNLIDRRSSYAEDRTKVLTQLFREMVAVHTADILRLAAMSSHPSTYSDPSNSFVSAVHRTVVSMRSMFAETDERILPSLICGEERVVKTYDEAIEVCAAGALRTELNAQRARLHNKIEKLRRIQLRRAN
jgi:Domain of unknown function (DUF2383)